MASTEELNIHGPHVEALYKAIDAWTEAVSTQQNQEAKERRGRSRGYDFC